MEAVSVAVAVAILACIGPGCAAHLQSEKASVDTRDRVVVLDDGTRVWPAEDRFVLKLREGVTVKLLYEEQGGRHVLTSIESAE